ncbi:PEP-CTERM sorting domain-containing protein [Roseateles sp. P5_E11]
MNKTSMTLALALASATLLTFTAQAATPNYGSYAGTTGGNRSGGEGSFSAMANTPSYYKYSYAWGMAALSDGTLHAASSAIPCPGCHAQTGAESLARFWDTVAFHNGQNLGLANLTVSIDGTLTPGGYAQAWARFYVGDPKADFFDHLNDYAPAMQLKSGTTVLGDELAIPLGNSKVFIYAELHTSAVALPYAGSPNTSADFGNTLHFNWTLPDGVMTSSASGQFMTAAAVPEPSSWMMAGAGLLVLVRLQRRRAGPSTAR